MELAQIIKNSQFVWKWRWFSVHWNWQVTLLHENACAHVAIVILQTIIEQG